MDRSRVAPSISKSDDLQNADTGIKRNGEHIADLHAMTGRFFADAVDPDTPLCDQSRSI